VVPLKH